MASPIHYKINDLTTKCTFKKGQAINRIQNITTKQYFQNQNQKKSNITFGTIQIDFPEEATRYFGSKLEETILQEAKEVPLLKLFFKKLSTIKSSGKEFSERQTKLTFNDQNGCHYSFLRRNKANPEMVTDIFVYENGPHSNDFSQPMFTIKNSDKEINPQIDETRKEIDNFISRIIKEG